MITEYPINEKLAGIVPMATETEQEALNEDIKIHGLREPIVLWRGQIVDGRCRQKACIKTNTLIKIKNLDDELLEEDVVSLVKSLNTRRNLTVTQKVMIAAYESLEGKKISITKAASRWGVGTNLIKNARKIIEWRPKEAKYLFDGKNVDIIDKHGKQISSNRISAVYAWALRYREVNDGVGSSVVEHYGWSENSIIKTQHAKEFYYEQIGFHDVNPSNTLLLMVLADYANLKYPETSVETKKPIVNTNTQGDEEMSLETFREALKTTNAKIYFDTKIADGMKFNLASRHMFEMFDRTQINILNAKPNTSNEI